MLFEAPKVVFLISPQRWDGPKVSKHHYATELAGLGHRVFFIEPPRSEGAVGVKVLETETPGVTRVSYRPPYPPYVLKYHAPALYQRFAAGEARRIQRALGVRPDLVWDMDNLYWFDDLAAFDADVRILHLVDEVIGAPRGDKRADLVLLLSQRFLGNLTIPRERVGFIPHGLNRAHAAHAARGLEGDAAWRPQGLRPLVGYVGNLDHPDVDWDAYLAAIRRNPEVDFVFIGPCDGRPAKAPVEALRAAQNCRLTGLLGTAELLEWADKVDVWTLFHHLKPGWDTIIDSHKLLEYVASGRAIVSSPVESFVGTDILRMPASNAGVVDELKRALGDLAAENSPEKARRRRQYAIDRTYLANIRRIDAAIDEALAPRRRSARLASA